MQPGQGGAAAVPDKGGPVAAVSSQGGAQIIRRRIEERNARLEAELFGDAHQSQGISFEKYEDIPVEVSGNDAPLPITSFLDTALPDIIKSNVQLSGYTNPTPVQKYAIPIGLAGRDIMACAQTGIMIIYLIICLQTTFFIFISHPHFSQIMNACRRCTYYTIIFMLVKMVRFRKNRRLLVSLHYRAAGN